MSDDRQWFCEDEQRRLIVEAAENGMLLVDEAGTIELANAAAERIFGYAPGRLRGRPAAILECAEIAAALGSHDDSSASIDPLGISASGRAFTARHADGSTVPLHIRSQSIRTGAGRLVLIVLDTRDVGAPAQRSDAELGRPEGIGAEDLDGVQGGRWRYDLGTDTLTWSDEVYRIYGLPAGYQPTIESAVAAIDPADRARVAALLERVRSEGTPYRDEARINRPDGTSRSVVYGGGSERSADGAIVAVAGFIQDVTDYVGGQLERQRLSEYLRIANQAGKIGIWELDLRTNQSVWDRNMYALYGIDDVTIVPTFDLWNATLHPHDRHAAVRKVNSDISGGAPSDTEFRIIWPNGEIHYVRSLVTIVHEASGTPVRIVGTDWDVTEVRSLGEQLREEKEALVGSEARYRALTEAMPQMVWVIDAALQFEYVNRRWAEYTGLSLDGSRGIGLCGLVAPADAAQIGADRWAAASTEYECELRLRRFDGSFRWHLVRSVPFRDATGDAGKWIVTATDIEERKAAEKTLAATVAELEHIARHDPMTDLPNRTLLMERLTQAMNHADRSDSGVIVLYVDLDRFKSINDTFGHEAGDGVLKHTGLRIQGILRAGDTASRVGGDEFIVVCATPAPDDDVAPIATRLLNALTAPIDIGGERHVIEASIGVSVYPQDGGDADTLIRKADAAMYLAKQNGRNTFCRYGNETQMSILAAAEFEAELRHAIASGQLVVHYQPIIDVRTGRPRSAEALVRWQHPERGLLSPLEFIAFAEERGLIAQIGAVVLETTCSMLLWLQRCGRGDVKIGVNVSAHQFAAAGFVDGIVTTLARHDTDPRRLAIEITESVVMGNTRSTRATLDELSALGVSLSIDDFGTGYSSLAYIKKFPIATLKIDRSFVRDISEDRTDQAIAKTIITLAHSLGMRVVAEGVETQAQLAILREFDVDSIQGYLFSRPLSAADFQRFIVSFPPPSARSAASAAG